MFIKAKFVFLNLILLILSISTVMAVEITTTIDRNPVNISDSFQIIFTAAQSPDDDPDFSPLEKDFEIINQSHQSNSSWINGQSSKSIQWILNVIAKKTGNLSIPAIHFGNDTSQTAVILVKQSTTNNPGNTNNDSVFLEVEVSSETPYVQAQVLYTVRFFRRVQIAQASLNEPELEDAIIERLGEDKNYNTEINGVAYVVTERKYAIFPQKSGVFTLASLQLTAEIVSNSRPRFNGFFSRQATKTRRVSSKAITLNVQAAPDDFTGKRWIPSEQLYIREEWSGDITKMKLGEPLTRTLTLLAKGTTVAQLPELHREIENTQLKTYPDKANLQEQKKADGLIAFREEKIAYIPSKPGRYTLPAIEIPWFNTVTKKMEFARIAEQTVTAIGIANKPENTTDLVSPIPTESVNTEQVIHTVENKFWMWLSFVLAIAWLITLFFLLKKIKPKQQEVIVDKKEIKLKSTVKALKQACSDNSAVAAKDALLAWGKLKYNATNLASIANHCEARLRDEIQLLNQSLYASQSAQWQGKKLFQTFTENNAREKVSKKTNEVLEPLFKV